MFWKMKIKEIHLVMERLLLIIITSHFSFIGYSQGLRGEYSFNNNYRHLIDGLICSNDATFIVHSADSFNVPWSLNRTFLCKMNAQGQKEWEISGAPPIGEHFWTYGITEDGYGVTYLLGSNEACDYSTSYRYVLRNVSEIGEINWEKVWHDNNGGQLNWEFHIHGFTRDYNGKYLFNYSQNSTLLDSSSIVIYDSFGDLEEILQIDQYNLTQIRFGTNYHIIGSSGNSLFGFNNLGETENSIILMGNILGFELHNGLIYVLTQSMIYSFQDDFTPVSSAPLEPYTINQKLKIVNGQLTVLRKTNSEVAILKLNNDLSLFSNQIIDAIALSNPRFDFNETHLALSNYHQLFAFGSSRFRDYSLNNPNSITINRTDIGVSDITINYVGLSPASGAGPGVQNLSIYASAKITNFGNYTLNSCRIGYFQGMHWVCGQMGYSQVHEDLNLAPGESIWIDLGQIHYETNYFGWTPPNGEFTKNICVYTSNPNGHTDIQASNDAICKTVVFGYVDLEENVLNPLEKKLVKIVDLLGREIEYGTNQLMIYIYDDGSSDKIFVSE